MGDATARPSRELTWQPWRRGFLAPPRLLQQARGALVACAACKGSRPLSFKGNPMAILFQDQFEVKEVGKKFDKVTRLLCRLAEEDYEMGLDLDINSDLYTLDISDRFTFTLAATLAPDGTPDSGVFDQSGTPSLLDQYDYAMYGKLYKWKQDQPKAPVEIYISFGGLLMRLKGDARHLAKLSLDARIYLLLRKIVQK